MQIDDFLLRRVALALAVAGLLALAAIAELQKPTAVEIGEISEGMLGEEVSAAGIVTWRQYTKNALIFGIEDSAARINAVRFSPGVEELAVVERGAAVRVSGTVKRYKGKLEIVAESVQLLEEAREND